MITKIHVHMYGLAESEAIRKDMVYRLLDMLGAPLGAWQASNYEDDRACGFLGSELEPPAADMLLNPSWTSGRIGVLAERLSRICEVLISTVSSGGLNAD